jgi:putative MATE family efflux protein
MKAKNKGTELPGGSEAAAGGLEALDRGISRQMWSIALPVTLGSLIETLYNLTDAFFLGKLGSAQISAPSIAFSLIFFLIVFGMGFSGAGTTLIAQAKGRGDRERMSFYLGQMTFLLIVVSLFLACLGLGLARPLLRLLGTPEEVFGYTYTYTTICFLGIPFSFIYYALQAAFTAVGDSFTPLWVHLVAVALNVALDPLLIFGLGPIPALGVAGAAIATVSSQAVSAAISLAILVKGRHGMKLSLSNLRPRAEAQKLIVDIGLPSSVGQAISSLGFTVLQGFVNAFGASAIAAFGVGNRITGLFDIPARGIASAATTLVGQALGARDEARAKRVVRISLKGCLIFMTPLLVFAFFFGGDLIRFFVNDPEAIKLGDVMFKIVSPSVLMFGLFLAATGAFQGAGDTRVIMVLSIVRLWVLRVPLAWLFASACKLGPLSIWYAMFISNTLTALAGFIYYREGKWIHAMEGRKV